MNPSLPAAVLAPRLLDGLRVLPEPWIGAILIYEALVAGIFVFESFLIRRVHGPGGDPTGSSRATRRIRCIWVVIFLLLQLPLLRVGRWPALLQRSWFVVGGGALLAVAGEGLRLHAILTLRRHFSYAVRVRDNHRLVTRGAYRLLRHPAYTGLLLYLTGLGLVTTSLWCLFLLVTPALVILLLRIRKEERFLHRHFGAEYERWRARTWRLVPLVY